ncbi:MAG: aspartate/glutamate racemase family protein [Rhodobacteraceae bacterium]|nr:aspartate/glutamate racemase family protein [Paracoccaceae bacterium]
MLKHRGFPGRLPGSDLQFTIRRASPRGVTPLKARERFRDRRAIDKKADTVFMACLWEAFGDQPFERGNLDAGRIGWFFGREVVPAENSFDPVSYEAMLRIDVKRAKVSFPDMFEGGEP